MSTFSEWAIISLYIHQYTITCQLNIFMKQTQNSFHTHIWPTNHLICVYRLSMSSLEAISSSQCAPRMPTRTSMKNSSTSLLEDGFEELVLPWFNRSSFLSIPPSPLSFHPYLPFSLILAFPLICTHSYHSFLPSQPSLFTPPLINSLFLIHSLPFSLFFFNPSFIFLLNYLLLSSFHPSLFLHSLAHFPHIFVCSLTPFPFHPLLPSLTLFIPLSSSITH